MTEEVKQYGVGKTSFSEIKRELGRYLGVENSKREQVIALVNDFFGVKNSDGRLKKLGELGLLLAGGAINSIYSGRKVNDLDFYIKDTEYLADAKAYFTETLGEPVQESPNAITYKRTSGKNKYEVQLITRFSGTPRQILDTFDFTIVQGCYDFSTQSFVLDDKFLPDIAARVLRYTSSSHYPICALIRTKKYQDRGYHFTNSCRLAISFAINRLDLTTYKNLKEQLLGIDTTFLRGFLETLDDDQELSDQERMEFIEVCCTMIDNQVTKIFGLTNDGDSEKIDD